MLGQPRPQQHDEDPTVDPASQLHQVTPMAATTHRRPHPSADYSLVAGCCRPTTEARRIPIRRRGTHRQPDLVVCVVLDAASKCSEPYFVAVSVVAGPAAAIRQIAFEVSCFANPVLA
jgi:hypothetical protein